MRRVGHGAGVRMPSPHAAHLARQPFRFAKGTCYCGFSPSPLPPPASLSCRVSRHHTACPVATHAWLACTPQAASLINARPLSSFDTTVWMAGRATGGVGQVSFGDQYHVRCHRHYYLPRGRVTAALRPPHFRLGCRGIHTAGPVATRAFTAFFLESLCIWETLESTLFLACTAHFGPQFSLSPPPKVLAPVHCKDTSNPYTASSSSEPALNDIKVTR